MRKRFSIMVLALLAWSCDDDDDDGGVGSSCDSALECYGDVEGDVEGEPLCLDRVEGGYCTHLCGDDNDCCAVEGECPNGKEQVCAPFESTNMRMCFLSCEGEDDGDAYCDRWAHVGFTCRSTGGGAANRKVCLP